MAGVPGARCPVAGARCPVSSPLFIYVFFYILIFLRPLHKKASGGLAPNDTLRPQTACTERKQNYSKAGHCRTSTVVVSVPVIGLLGLNLVLLLLFLLFIGTAPIRSATSMCRLYHGGAVSLHMRLTCQFFRGTNVGILDLHLYLHSHLHLHVRQGLARHLGVHLHRHRRQLGVFGRADENRELQLHCR